MKRFLLVLLLCMLLTLILPAALADTLGLYFGSQQVIYRPGEGVPLTVKAMHAAEADIRFTVTDQRGNSYSAVLPKGKDRVEFRIMETLPEDGSRTIYTLDSGEGYVRRTPGSCSVIPKGSAAFGFAERIYQTYVGREVTVKARVETSGALPENANILITDDQGNVLASFAHFPNRTAYSVTFETDDSWVPGKRLQVWVEGRDTPDDETLVAIGYSGVKAIWGVDRADNKIAFTMDCGSHNRYVMRILDILDQFNVKITFFVTGKFAAANPEMVREMAARGHEVGNHSWNHPDFDTLNKDEIYSELTRTSDLLEALTGKPVTVFRPPYGHLSGQTRSIVNALGMSAVRWTHESMDARKEGSEENSLKYSTKDMKGGSIILTHTSTACTLAVLDQILQFYQDNGFEVVPVSQLLLEGPATIDENGIQHSAR